MKRFSIFLFAFILATGQSLIAQTEQDQVLMTINNKNITKNEFERIYKKNNNKDNPVDIKSLDEYLELFINFKLKVTEAELLGMDTSAAFKKELAGYRKQLATPYLVDKDVDEQLLKEAYDRKMFDIRASHILINCDENAAPSDTLKAYEKAMKLRDRVSKGEPFDKVASENSDDPSAKSNGGDLGFFTVFQMVYPFESIAYITKVGDITMPVRTRFGYHVIKITERRPAQGEIKVAHIMVAYAKDAKPEEVKAAEEKINTIYAKIKAGGDFAKLAEEFSDDKGSAKKGGELPWFGTGKMVPEFEKAAFDLKNPGDISGPVRTAFGWHIIKKVDTKKVESFENMKADLKTKISKDARAKRSRNAVIERLKKEYSYKETPKALDDFYKVVTDSIFNGTWKLEEAKGLNKVLFSMTDSVCNQQAFAKNLADNKRKSKKTSIKTYVDDAFKRFTEEYIIRYEEDRLEKKYPDFRYLMNEYHDGILLFDLTDKMVWTKAIKDTLGLEDFYQKNKNNYMWGERSDATSYFCKDEKTKKAVEGLLAKRDKKGYSDSDILKIINTDTVPILRIETGKYSKGDNKWADFYTWNTGTLEELNKASKELVIFVFKKLDPMPKTLQEAKGLVTADYQSFLEKKWIEELRSKYKINVNKDVLHSIK